MDDSSRRTDRDSQSAVGDEDAALSPLERDVLDEYAALVGNLDAVCHGRFFPLAVGCCSTLQINPPYLL